jgi:hypothetical protein
MKAPKLTEAQYKKQNTPTNPKTAKCFKCEQLVGPAADPGILGKEAVWKMPWPAVVFHDGGNFGSTLYDRAYDGIGVDVIICDNCLVKHRKLIKITKTIHCYKDVGEARKKGRGKQGKSGGCGIAGEAV